MLATLLPPTSANRSGQTGFLFAEPEGEGYRFSHIRRRHVLQFQLEIAPSNPLVWPAANLSTVVSRAKACWDLKINSANE